MRSGVLVVDDHADTGRVLTRLIRHAGHLASAVDSGVRAIEWMADRVPSMVILDQTMPNMDGLTVLRLMRQEPRLKHVPVVMFAAVVDPRFCERAKNEGANDCWIKGGIDYHQLPQMIAPYLATAQG